MLKQALSNALTHRAASSGTSTPSYLSDLLSFGGNTVSSIAQSKALSLSALYNGVTIISNDIAMLPKAIYTQNGDNKQKDANNPLYRVISKQPNQIQTSFWFHKIMIQTAILRGNAIAVIRRNNSTGKIDPDNALVFIHPDHLHDIRKVDGQLWFFTKKGVFANHEVIHIKGFSTNGITGESVLKYAAKNLNAALTAEDFAQTNFDSKGFGLGVIKSDKKLDTSAKQILSTAMSKRLSAGGAYNIGVLDEGMEFAPIQVSAQEAQLIDWKKTSIEDIARWLNINPYKLKQTDKLNYSTIEQQSLDHLSDSIMPWTVQFEQEYDTKLFTESEQANRYAKFNVNALLRVDAKSRAEFYNKLIFSGVASGNEIRVLEDMNPLDIEHMKVPLQPVQLQQQSQINTNGSEQ